MVSERGPWEVPVLTKSEIKKSCWPEFLKKAVCRGNATDLTGKNQPSPFLFLANTSGSPLLAI